MSNEIIKIKNVENLGLVVSSRDIAIALKREHKNVIRDLEQILTSSDLSRLIFSSNYKDSRNRIQKQYLLTKDGFTLYMFNIQGYQDFKMNYIKRFNEMEKILSNQKNSDWLLTREKGKLVRRKETDTIQDLIVYAITQGSQNASKLYMTYSKLVNKLVGIEANSRDTIEFKQLISVQQLEDLFSKVIKDNMNKKVYYKEIYQRCKAIGTQYMAVINYDLPLLEKVS